MINFFVLAVERGRKGTLRPALGQVRLPRWLCGKESTVSAGDTDAWVQSLGCEDLLEKGMTTHSSILAREIT